MIVLVCRSCAGTGEVPEPVCSPSGVGVCRDCRGAGRIDVERAHELGAPFADRVRELEERVAREAEAG